VKLWSYEDTLTKYKKSLLIEKDELIADFRTKRVLQHEHPSEHACTASQGYHDKNSLDALKIM